MTGPAERAKANGEESAFPDEHAYGLTKRESMAQAAMQSLICHPGNGGADFSEIARRAATAADALLLALEEAQP